MNETVVRMPRLADTLVEGTLAHWLKAVGDAVQAGEPLAAIDTDKVSTELTAPASGTLLDVLVQDGQTVPVDTPLARIGTPSTSTPASAPDTRSPRAPTASDDAEWNRQPDSSSDDEPRPGSGARAALKPTPVAARILADHGLRASDLGRTGRLTKSDVLDHLASRSTTSIRAPLSSLRRAIAAHMTRSAATIRQGSAVMAADLTDLAAWREAHKTRFAEHDPPAPLTFTVLFAYALAATLAEHTRAAVHLGVAVAVDGGVVVPVLRDAHRLSIHATATLIFDLAQRARASALTAAEMQGATLTLTNVGSFGNLTALPLIPVGQAGIFAPGLVSPVAFPTPEGGIRRGRRSLVAFVFDRDRIADLDAEHLLRRFVTTLSSPPTL